MYKRQDYLSGTSDGQGRDGEWGSFWTLYDTGHKYYGLIDMFLGVGSGNNTSGVSGLGLQDLAVKYKMKPVAGWTVKADYHWFWTAEGIAANPVTSRVAAGNSSAQSTNFLGNELDITAVTKMNANTKVMIGYSNYSTSEGFRLLKGQNNTVGSEDANWGYVQFDVKF